MSKNNILIPIGESAESRHILNCIPDFFPPEESELVLIQVANEPDTPTEKSVPDLAVPKTNEAMMTADVVYHTQRSRPDLVPASEDEIYDDDVKPKVYASQEEERRRFEIRDVLNEIARPLQKEGYNVSTAVRFGEPAEEILAFVASADKPVDLIAMATHGRSGLSRLLKGSVAEDVLRQSGVPLMLVRPPETD